MSCYAERLFPRIRTKPKKGSSQRSEMWDRVANTLNTCPKPVFAVDKRSVRDHVGILINRIKKKLRAEERSSGIAPPEPTELELLVEEIVALEETADAEMKEDDENVKGKAEKEKAKATDMRLKALEKVSETMKRHSGENDQEKVKKRERRSGSETMLFLSKKAEKDQEPGGSVAEWSACRTRNPAVPRSSPALATSWICFSVRPSSNPRPRL